MTMTGRAEGTGLGGGWGEDQAPGMQPASPRATGHLTCASLSLSPPGTGSHRSARQAHSVHIPAAGSGL